MELSRKLLVTYLATRGAVCCHFPVSNYHQCTAETVNYTIPGAFWYFRYVLKERFEKSLFQGFYKSEKLKSKMLGASPTTRLFFIRNI